MFTHDLAGGEGELRRGLTGKPGPGTKTETRDLIALALFFGAVVVGLLFAYALVGRRWRLAAGCGCGAVAIGVGALGLWLSYEPADPGGGTFDVDGDGPELEVACDQFETKLRSCADAIRAESRGHCRDFPEEGVVEIVLELEGERVLDPSNTVYHFAPQRFHCANVGDVLRRLETSPLSTTDASTVPAGAPGCQCGQESSVLSASHRFRTCARLTIALPAKAHRGRPPSTIQPRKRDALIQGTRCPRGEGRSHVIGDLLASQVIDGKENVPNLLLALLAIPTHDWLEDS